MSDEGKKSIINTDEIKRRGQRAVDSLCSLGRGIKDIPPELAKYAGGVVGKFDEARKNPDSAMARAEYRIAKEQHNLDSIARKAGEEMPPEDVEKIADIEYDWKASFMNEAKNISDKEMQMLWANILRGKARDSGAFSKRTIKLVSEMDKKDAEMFAHFCQFIFSGSPLIYDYNATIYGHEKWRMFHVLKHLDSMGLISADTTAGYITELKDSELMGEYHGRFVVMHIPLKKEKHKFSLGSAILTETGTQLVPICNALPNWEFWKYLLAEWQKRGYKPVEAFNVAEAMHILSERHREKPPA